MTTPQPYEPLSTVEKLENEASVAGLAAAEAVRGIEIAGVILLVLLVCPPLAILVVLVGGPLLVAALVLALVAAVVWVPYVLVRHFRARHRAPRP